MVDRTAEMAIQVDVAAGTSMQIDGCCGADDVGGWVLRARRYKWITRTMTEVGGDFRTNGSGKLSCGNEDTGG